MGSDLAHGVAPGKRTRSEQLPARAGGAEPSSAPTSAQGGGPTAVPREDPFALHLGPSAAPVAGGGGGGGDEPPQTTEADMEQEGTEGGAAAAAGGGAAAGVGGGGAAAAATPTAGPEPAASAMTGATQGGEAGAGGGAAGAGAGARAATPSPLYIMGPRELWFFENERPPGYDVSQTLRSNQVGGTFAWSCSANLTLSANGSATPTVTTAAASVAARDAWIRLRHTDATGAATVASYRLTIMAPKSLTHLRNDDTVDASFAYATFVHYSINDQFGAVLPRNVPINEQFTAPPTADVVGMDWRRGAAGAATVSPTDWSDHIQGETAGHTPAPVQPGQPGDSTLVYHWPGDWRVGSLTVGSGRRVATVTWSKSRGFARHT